MSLPDKTTHNCMNKRNLRDETIFALSSGHGKAGIAVIRVSGSDLRELTDMATFDKSRRQAVSKPIRPLRPRYATLMDVFGIDKAVVIYFPAPNSFTGEDVVEIQCHGSISVIEAIFAQLRARGLRMAEPGEFARRAFKNGKMDLIEADGLSALLDARTERQRLNALKMTASSAAFENWRLQMVEISAFAAAILDFPSDELPKNIGADLVKRVRVLHGEIVRALSSKAKTIQSGFRIALVGETNVGKSSLFNRLIGESRAIVSNIAGTTRDVVSAELDIDGYLVCLSDTAGLRESPDVIESMGIKKTREEIKNADLILRVVQNHEIKEKRENWAENEILVINKADLLRQKIMNQKSKVYVSALTGQGMMELLSAIREKIHEQLDCAESDVAVNERARELLQNAAGELSDALAPSLVAFASSGGETKFCANWDIFAEHVRRAADSIGRILGVIGSDEIADAVFGQLCLGK